MIPMLLLLLLAVQVPTAAEVPATTQTEPDETYTVACTFVHPAYSGPCSVSESVSKALTPLAACTRILTCLNDSRCIRTYCNATTVRGGWKLTKSGRGEAGGPVSPEPRPADGRSSQAPLPSTIASPRLVAHKASRRLELYSGKSLLRTYRIGLGLNPVPPKERQGDRATPEGTFHVRVRNAQSQFYRSLGLSYPAPADAARGLRAGLITRRQHDAILAAHRRGIAPPWDTPLGGEIFIHGHGSGTDWTWGCIALDDPDIRELFGVIPVGTPVEITP
jgi:lipoprotein-anchoring transpeptidase ErfK/SrfK